MVIDDGLWHKNVPFIFLSVAEAFKQLPSNMKDPYILLVSSFNHALRIYPPSMEIYTSR